MALTRVSGLLLVVAGTAACHGRSPQAWGVGGPPADSLEQLWWTFFGVTSVAYVLVLGTLGTVMLRRREPETGPAARAVGRVAAGIALAAAVTLACLLVLLAARTSAGRRVRAYGGPHPDAASTDLLGRRSVGVPHASSLVDDRRPDRPPTAGQRRQR